MKPALDKSGCVITGGELLNMHNIQALAGSPGNCLWVNDYTGVGLVLSIEASTRRYNEPVVRVMVDDGRVLNVTMTKTREGCQIMSRSGE